MLGHLRSRFQRTAGICLLSLAAGTLLAVSQSHAADKGPSKLAEPITKGQRIACASHSFHVFMPDILKEMVEAAGIKDHVRVAQSSIGGSTICALERAGQCEPTQGGIATGKVDVLSLAPLYAPMKGSRTSPSWP